LKGEAEYFPFQMMQKMLICIVKVFEQAKVNLRLNSPVQEIKAKNNTVTGVVLKDGTEVPCDAVVLPQGVLHIPVPALPETAMLWQKNLDTPL